MARQILLAATFSGPLVSAKVGPTFGNGYLPGEGWFCKKDNEGRGTTVINHTIGADSLHGVLTHFWATGPNVQIDRVWVSYFLDGESVPSIRFQPSMACGVAFPQHYNSMELFSAGSMCGKNAAVGGYWHNFPIPFAKSALVTVQPDPVDGDCVWGYMNVRGTENLPFKLPGSDFVLPSSARMQLHKNELATHQPLEYVNLFDIPAGLAGVVFQTAFAVEDRPVGGPHVGGGFIEGCYQFYPTAATPFPGVVVGTGVEDYFDSSYYFGADTQFGAQKFATEQSGLTLFQRTPADGYERLSAYRFHVQDPLVFTDGGRLVWRVGMNDTKGVTKCGAPFPKKGQQGRPPLVTVGPGNSARELSPVNMTSYVWVYTWPQGDDIALV